MEYKVTIFPLYVMSIRSSYKLKQMYSSDKSEKGVVYDLCLQIY